VNTVAITSVTTADCSVCKAGYTRTSPHHCTRCNDRRSAGGTVVITLVLAVIALTLWYSISYLLTVDDTAVTTTSLCAAPMQFLGSIPWSKLRIPVIVFQILTQYVGISGLRLPVLFTKALSWTRVFNLSIGSLLSYTCVLPVSFYDRLLINTLVPLAVLLLLRVTYSLVQHREKERAVAAPAPATAAAASEYSSNDDIGASVNDQLAVRLQRALTKHHTVFLVMTFLLYSTVSTVVFQTFACDVIEPTGESYLRADYSLSCQTSEHLFYKWYAAVMVSFQACIILSDACTLAVCDQLATCFNARVAYHRLLSCCILHCSCMLAGTHAAARMLQRE
jgi:hypothetical protein